MTLYCCICAGPPPEMVKFAVGGLMVRAVRPGGAEEPPVPPVLPVVAPDPVETAPGLKEHPTAHMSVPTMTATGRRREAAPTRSIVSLFITYRPFRDMRVRTQIARCGPQLAVTQGRGNRSFFPASPQGTAEGANPLPHFAWTNL